MNWRNFYGCTWANIVRRILNNVFNLQPSNQNVGCPVNFGNSCLVYSVAIGLVQRLFRPALTFRRFESSPQRSSSGLSASTSFWSGSVFIIFHTWLKYSLFPRLLYLNILCPSPTCDSSEADTLRHFIFSFLPFSNL